MTFTGFFSGEADTKIKFFSLKKMSLYNMKNFMPKKFSTMIFILVYGCVYYSQSDTCQMTDVTIHLREKMALIRKIHVIPSFF